MAKKVSASTKRKMSLASRGTKNPMYGKKHTAAALKKIAKASAGKNNPMFGRRHSAEARKKISLARRKALALRRKKQK